MKDKEGIASDNEDVAPGSDMAKNARDMAAASMVDKLGGLQEIASQHGFDFLHYMLDIARAEAERLHHEDPQRDSDSSIDSD